jgi:hypothetical protein
MKRAWLRIVSVGAPLLYTRLQARTAVMSEVETRKEVFAWFGSAAYLAQCLEQELVTVLLLFERFKNPLMQPTEFDSLEQLLARKTLGGLVKELEASMFPPEELKGLLTGYLSKRNYLAHRYFFENAESFVSRDGREKMIQELKAICAELQEGNAIAEKMSAKLRSLIGIPQETADSIVAEFYEGQKRVDS